MSRDKHVRRFEIAMDDAARVQRLERFEHGQQQRQRVDGRLRTRLEHVGQRLSFEQLHDEKQLASVFRDLVDLADAGMVHGGGGAGLAPDPLVGRGTDVSNGLDRHRAVQFLVNGGIDHTHATLTQFVSDPVGADSLWQFSHT